MALKESKVRLYEDDENHYYVNEKNKRISGLTDLLKRHGLAPDYGNIPPWILKEAAHKGSVIHAECQMWDMAGIEPSTLDGIAYKDLELSVIANEFLVSYKDIVATKIDVILADYSVCDIKTTSKLNIEYVTWQCSIGAYMLEKQCNIKVPYIYLIHLRDGIAKVIQLERKTNEEIEQLLDAEEKGIILLPTVKEPSYELSTQLQKDIKKTLLLYDEMSKKIDKFREFLALEMERTGTTSIKSDSFSITYKKGGSRKVFDHKKCVEENPEMSIFYKNSDVKSSVIIKLNKDEND